MGDSGKRGLKLAPSLGKKIKSEIEKGEVRKEGEGEAESVAAYVPRTSRNCNPTLLVARKRNLGRLTRENNTSLEGIREDVAKTRRERSIKVREIRDPGERRIA